MACLGVSLVPGILPEQKVSGERLRRPTGVWYIVRTNVSITQ